MTANWKIVVAGPAGVGKSTALRSLGGGDSRCNATEVSGRNVGRPVTAGLDYAEVDLDASIRLRVFGVPGEPRFSHMQEVVARSCSGLIVLVDNTSFDPVSDCMMEIDRYRRDDPELPVVVGITRTEACPDPRIGDYDAAFARCGVAASMVTIDARRRDDMLSLLDLLMIEIEDSQRPCTRYPALREACS